MTKLWNHPLGCEILLILGVKFARSATTRSTHDIFK